MIEMIVEDAKWKQVPGVAAKLKRAVALALTRGSGAKKYPPLTLLLTKNSRLRELNARFRGKDKPTNVLSFPASDAHYLGDVAIAYGVMLTEARAEGKKPADHAVHLAVHGTLHLLGYDHERDKDARIMEALEIDILAKLGIADPYAKTKHVRA
ncbi:MAG: rRNA maturation RNase YbeY [Rhizomicrobium sp.]|jgi:probable rRNA maturation factor